MAIALNQDARIRGGSGLAVAIAIHAGLALAVLYGLDIVTLPKAPPTPITARNIDAPKPPQTQTTPNTRDIAIKARIEQPVIDIEKTVERHDPPPTGAAGDTAGTAADPGPGTVERSVAPTGPTSIARLDLRYASDFQPPYPGSDARLDHEGIVTVHVRIGRDGRVLAASVARSSGYAGLDQAAVRQATARWRFIPALDNGTAVEAERDIAVHFVLKRS